LFGSLSGQEVGRVTGTIAYMRKDQVKVTLGSENIPDWLNHSTIGMDPEFDDKTYLEMVQALNKVIEPGKNRRLKELREILLGPVEPAFHDDWKVKYQNPELNPSQNKAISKVLEARDVAIIHGPPGTGKTTTMVNAIKEVLHHEHQVLVCAPSNAAVDLLTLKCHLAGMKVVRLGNPVRVEEALQTLTLDGWIAEHDDYQSLRKLRIESENLRKKALKFKRKFGAQERSRRGELLKEARELKKLSHQLEDYILFQVLNRAQVITATLAGAAHSVIRDKQFHTVFIDEAAQALAPAAWIPILKAKRVIMAGDHCQLPPTVKSFEAEKKGLGKTLFEQIIETKAEVATMLNEQYRMNEQIMRFSGRQFYHDQLYANQAVKDHLLGEGFPAVEFVDTAGCGFEEKKNPETQSTSNPDEANLLLKHLAVLVNKISAADPELLEGKISIGIISPYKAQIKALRQQIQSSPMLSEHLPLITLNTVDGFQGQERDVIYISLVRSNDKNEIGFLKDIRRMNVALTRARKKLVVVGNSATLGNHPFYSAFLDYVDEIGAYKSAWEWV
jgi:ATP-dependent RNA/DNA helicase IGHMBP2